MNLSDELKRLRNSVKDQQSQKTEHIIDSLKRYALRGLDKATFSESFYDESTIKHLRTEGLHVEKISDSRDGDYILVKF